VDVFGCCPFVESRAELVASEDDQARCRGVAGEGCLVVAGLVKYLAQSEGLMTSPTPDHWQIQDAKQRFSEMIRAFTSTGPQVITRHGEDVAVVVDIAEYRRLTRPVRDVAAVLLGGPKLDDGAVEVFAEVEAGRKAYFGRSLDLGGE
jgi:prevent-host-death family protein